MRNAGIIGIAVVVIAFMIAQRDANALGVTDWYDDSTHIAQRAGGNFIGGTGVTVTSADDPANTQVDITIAVDGTGLATTTYGAGDAFTWTFDSTSTGTDPVLVFSGGLANWTAGALEVGGDVVVTLDASQTVTNKSLTSPTITGSPTATGATWGDLGTVSTVNIDGGTLDGASVGQTTALTALTVDGGGLSVDPGSDTDTALVTVDVTGSPALSWDESEDRFSSGHGLHIADGGGLVVGHDSQLLLGAVYEFQVQGTALGDSSMTVGRWSADGGAGVIGFQKSRGATIGTNTVVQADDNIGQIIWYPADGSGNVDTAAASFRAHVDDSTPLNGDVGMRFHWAQMDGNGGALNETMRLTASGNLTVGGVEGPSTGSEGVFMGDGTAPASLASNTAGIYANDVAGTVEMFAIDEGGTATQLSPHPDDFISQFPSSTHPFPWAYHSRNDYLGKEIWVDWLGLILDLQDAAQKKDPDAQYVWLEDVDKRDWYSDQDTHKAKRDAEIARYNERRTALESALAVATTTTSTLALQKDLDDLGTRPPAFVCEHPPQWLQDRGVTAKACP